MKNKRFVITIIICIALVISFVLLTSYAYWRVSKTQTGTNDILGACLDIELEEDLDSNDNPIDGVTLENAWPITDEEGSSLPGYSFKVINKCGAAVTYQVVLDSLEVLGQRINTKFVKVKLDNGFIRKYDSLEDAEELGTDALASKKLYTGIVPKKENGINGEVTHTLRQWISLDSSNDDIGKSFSSRLRVIAGQNITNNDIILPTEGDGENENYGNSPLILVSPSEETEATISNINIGDIVKYKTEEFYVIHINENSVSLLSRYSINVGPYAKPGGTLGLQDAKIGNTRTSVNDYKTSRTYLYNDNGIAYGTIEYSNGNFWWNNDINDWVIPYSKQSFVYNSECNLKTYVDQYAETLRTMGLNVENGTILSIQDVGRLCNRDFSYPTDIGDCPKYLFETASWMGSAENSTTVWSICSDGSCTLFNLPYNTKSGIRPVINITLN